MPEIGRATAPELETKRRPLRTPLLQSRDLAFPATLRCYTGQMALQKPLILFGYSHYFMVGGGREPGVEPSPCKSACLAVDPRSPKTITRRADVDPLGPPFRSYGAQRLYRDRPAFGAPLGIETRWPRQNGTGRRSALPGSRRPATSSPDAAPQARWNRSTDRSL